ncbi:MAG: glycoside hydrolase family 97 protein [Bacteroidetes bacterium]|nr:glycoside hydrolase family 97 protein [Bacteroidota bacterium]MBU1580830.1 glycoside hydrolase family 97 protein [Bacteroidota bacterium]MBU2557563.1 glycoside hydrolase family 97 protein [Bacteroidota bacterium]
MLVIIMAALTTSCQKAAHTPQVKSPDGQLAVTLISGENGKLGYTLSFKNELLIDTSWIGFEFKDQPLLAEKLEVLDVALSQADESWEMPWGEQRLVRNHYQMMRVEIQEAVAPNRSFQMEFKLYDDGMGFRFLFPDLEEEQETIILDENTEFRLTADHQAWWIPGDWDIYEHLYNHSRISEINAIALRDHNDLAQTYIPENAVNTPVTMKTNQGIYLSFHEANLTDYADMTLKIDTVEFHLVSELVGSDRLGYKVKRSGPFHTPWRTIQVSETAAGLIESNLIVNLNEPNRLGDVSWFQPAKYVGIWWDMHLGTKTWDYASTQDMNTYMGQNPHGKHGATTAYAKELIDFAAENGIQAILVEGWNTGWEHWIGFEDREGVFDFVTPYPDYDLKEVVRYGKSKAVELIMHHETSAAPRTYDQQLDTAFKLMHSLGIHAVKTGYVGKIIPKGEYHHGQWMVNHYRRVLETAASYQIAINAHEPIKATGIRRTLPNAISREGLRGQEFNAWASDGGNPPNHLPTIAFTRMLAGPIDYTPGIFNIKLKPHKPDNQVNTTLAHQLALYVVINSPIQMVPDLKEAYVGHPAFQFIRDVAVNWEQTKVLNGEVGEFVTIARQDRNSANWFLGAITNEIARTLEIDLDFLEADKTYEARLYLDAEDAHWNDNPTAYKIVNQQLQQGDVLNLKLAPGGGAAVSLIPVE